MLNEYPKSKEPSLEISLKVATGVAGVGFPVAWVLFSGSVAFGWLAGAGWNLLNLILLKQLGLLLMTGVSKWNRKKLVFLLLAKFGLLYPAAIGLLWSEAVSIGGFAFGFTAVLIAITAGLIVQGMRITSPTLTEAPRA